MQQVFTTDKIAEIVGLPEWRVVRFAQDEKFGITPAFGNASGPGTRRLYDLENLCQMALASWLLQAGLRVDVIGRVLKQVHKLGGLSRFLVEASEKDSLGTYLAILRNPSGKLKSSLTSKKTSQEAVYIYDWERLGEIMAQKHLSSALVIDVGFRLQMFRRLTALQD